MTKYLVVHTHRFGVSTFGIEAEREPTLKEIGEWMNGIATKTFEPDLGETLRIVYIEQIAWHELPQGFKSRMT